jgi:lysophospholipase L1-like esterase
MIRLRPAVTRSLLALVLAVTALTPVQGQKAAAPPRRIAVFGSSVANGTGDDLAKEGYTGRLRELLAPRGWEVLNQSRGGDNTKTMAPRFGPEGAPDPKVRYLLTVNPSYVLLGLSLGNEGIQNGATKAEKDVIYSQFESGMRGFVARSREHHIVPIITLCYTRNDFTPVEYEYTRRMNLAINGWDVPSVNFLGAVDDGTGKWAKGFWHDSLHPNAAGHEELVRTFVPTLFDAIEQGKPAPTRSSATGFARVEGTATALSYTPDASMHPFAFGITVRTPAGARGFPLDGARGGQPSDRSVASISGSTLTAAMAMKTEQRGGGRGALEFETTTLTTAEPFLATIGVQGGVWVYKAADGSVVRSDVKADARPHHVLLSHYTARGESLFFVDGRLAGAARERLEPKSFSLGGPGEADFKDLLIYRSALNADEVAALESGRLLQASLEVYAPLAEPTFHSGNAIANLAQSLTSAKVGSGRVLHIDK